MEPKHDETASPWRMGKYQVVLLTALASIVLLLGCEFFRHFRRAICRREVVLQRVDPYGGDISREHVTITRGNEVSDPQSLFPGNYTLTVAQPGFEKVTMPLHIGHEDQMVVPLALVPLPVARVPLRIRIDDPLRAGDIVPDDVLLQSDQTSLENRSLRPGVYPVIIRKTGYHDKQVVVTVRKDGTVAEKVTLSPRPRPVRFLVADGLEDHWNMNLGHLPVIAADEIVLRTENGPVTFQDSLLPGHYELEVRRDGYVPYREQITIVAGTDLDYPVPLVPLERELVIDPQYTIPPLDPCPDRSYLQPYLTTAENDDLIHLVQNGKIVPRQVRPGKYRLFAAKGKYLPFRQEVFVEPGSRCLKYPVHFIPMSRTLILLIRCDYPVEPVLQPEFLMIDRLRVTGKGLYPLERKNLNLPPEREEVWVRVDMKTLPRELIAEIMSDAEGTALVPDLLALTKMKGDEPAGPKIHLVDDGKFLDVSVKPGRYLLEIEKAGFASVREPVLIEIDEVPMTIRRRLSPLREPR